VGLSFWGSNFKLHFELSSLVLGFSFLGSSFKLHFKLLSLVLMAFVGLSTRFASRSKIIRSKKQDFVADNL